MKSVFDTGVRESKESVVDGIHGSMQYEESQVILADPLLASPSKFRVILGKGQQVAHRGTVVYNPRPSDPEVEAVHGKKEFKRAVSPDSPTVVRERMKDMETLLAQQTKQIEILTAALGKNVSVPQAVGDAVDDIASMKYQDLQKLGSKRGINVKGMKKEEIIKALKA